MKKIVSLLLAVALVMGLGITVFAAGSPTSSGNKGSGGTATTNVPRTAAQPTMSTYDSEGNKLSTVPAGKIKKIAVGNPDSVPAGRYTKASLTKAGIWEKLQPKYIMAASVRQALDYVSRGEVDAGFVYRTDALKAGGKVKIVSIVEGHDPVLYPVAVALTGKNQADGQKFVDFITGPEGQAILKKFGFSEAK